MIVKKCVAELQYLWPRKVLVLHTRRQQKRVLSPVVVEFPGDRKVSDAVTRGKLLRIEAMDATRRLNSDGVKYDDSVWSDKGKSGSYSRDVLWRAGMYFGRNFSCDYIEEMRMLYAMPVMCARECPHSIRKINWCEISHSLRHDGCDATKEPRGTDI
tara:strand:- start:972 stop:1442 length:471 start_codon:yes stop_codon:yes gene_type:complete